MPPAFRVSSWATRGAALATVLAASAWTSRASATARYDVRAGLDEQGIRVAVDTTVTDGELAPGGTADVWLYADRQRAIPPSFDEFTAERLFVGDVSRGGWGPLRVEVDGCPASSVPAATEGDVDAVRGRIVTIALCPEARTPVRIEIRGELRLARRWGTLGRARDGTQLGDPWYPLLLPRGALAPPLARHRVTIATPAPRWIVAGGRAERTTRIDAEIDGATHAPAFVLDAAHVERETVRGVEVTFVTRREPVDRGAAGALDPSGPADPFDPDPASRIQGAVRRAIGFVRRLGMAPGDPARPLAKRLVVVEAEERQRLAVTLPGTLVVSDHAFRLLPIEQVERFHELGVLRRAFALLLEPYLRAIEPPRDVAWAADADGTLLVDLAMASDGESRRSPADLVGFAGFHPAVDQLLYAPQVAFRGEYFHEIDARDPARDGADRALHEGPFGHFVVERLRDRLGPERFARAAKAHLFEGASWRRAASENSDEDLAPFFARWLGPRPSVAYRLGAIASRPVGGGFEHRVEIERLGDATVREQVVVEVRDEDGERARATWDAPGARGTVVVRTAAPLDDVVIDPDRRLIEDPALSDVHPRWDDSLRHELRPPIFNSFAANVSIQQRPDLVADFSLRDRYDVRGGWAMRASSGVRGWGGSVRHLWGLGRLRDLNSTIATFSLGVSALRSDTGFGGGRSPVTEAGVVIGLGRDTRRQIYAPATGRSIAVSAFLGADRIDRDCGDGCARLAGSLSVRAQQLLWPAVTHVVALTAGASVARCPALPQSLPSLAGRQILRGYETDELLGCAIGYASIEERWSPLRGLYVNAADVAWGRRLEIVPFAAAGVLSTRDSPLDLVKRVWGELGLGLRGHYDYAGVQPGVLALDVAFPVSRTDACRQRDAAGRCLATRQPLGFWVSFEQTF